MAAIFTFDYDFPTTRSRRGTLSSISSRDDPITPSVYSPAYGDAVMEISTDDCRRVYSAAHTFGQTSIYEIDMQTPVSGGGLAGSVCEVVIEEPETPVKPASTKKAFFPGSLIVEEAADIEEIDFPLSAQSPILRHGKIHPFSGGRRRASISAVANAGGVSSAKQVEETLVSAGFAGVGGIAKMMAFEEIPSRGGSDIEDFSAANLKDKKRKSRRRKTSVSDIQKSFAKFTFNQRFKADEGISLNSSASASDEDTPFSNFKFEKRPVSSYSCSPATSNPGSDDEFSRARSCSPSPFRPGASGLGALLNRSCKKQSSLKVSTDFRDSFKKEVERYEVALDEDFVSKDVESVPSSPEVVSEPEQEHHHKMCADDFEQLKTLGKGTFGTVLLVRHKATGKLYAQKQLKKAHMVVEKKLANQVMTEKEILEAVRHPFVVKLYYAFQDHEKLYLILEYAEGGELFWHLTIERTFSEDVSAFYVACLVLALGHLHTKVGVVYRDLKPENCLLDSDGYLLLTDFGLSKVGVDGERCRSMLGTVEYMAPEVIEGKEYGAEVDWWGVGALLVDLLTGSSPFHANNDAKIRNNIVKKKLTLPYYLSADAKDLITKLLCKNPAKRLGSNMPKDYETIKKHRFFRKIDWKKLENRELSPPIVPIVTDAELAENFSADFTTLAMSPVIERFGAAGPFGANRCEHDDLFGGFSYVAQW